MVGGDLSIWWRCPAWAKNRSAWFAACREVGALDGTADEVPIDYFDIDRLLTQAVHSLRLRKIKRRELSLCD